MSDTFSHRPEILTVRDMSFIALFSALMAVCSWITIPTIVPFTLQTFAVFCALFTLGGKKGLFSVLVYIFLGLVGLPVFSGFKGGITALLSYSGGYITGFIFLALVFLTAEKLLGEKLCIKIISMLVGVAVMYAFGTMWFMYITKSDLKYSLGACVVPFIPFDLAKMALAFLISGRVKKFVR
ncbi:MAG: biotin transporter BioY [Ruminococcus sp.]|nr:biotin transporter BioY [Ruminococcus sp.]